MDVTLMRLKEILYLRAHLEESIKLIRKSGLPIGTDLIEEVLRIVVIAEEAITHDVPQGLYGQH